MLYTRQGNGRPLLLVHGLGSSSRSWAPIAPALASTRELIAVDLPGFGTTAPLSEKTTISSLCDALTEFLQRNDLIGIDAVGSSMGARLVIELARRGGVLGAVVSLDPGGFWSNLERHFAYASLYLSIRLVRLLQPVMPMLTANVVGRTVLMGQLSARPWRLPAGLVLDEVRNYAASPAFDELLYELCYGERQQGSPAGSIKRPLIIGWGRRDKLCLTTQARRALHCFPDARLHWFERSGHFPQWDEPAATARLILQATAERNAQEAAALSTPYSHTHLAGLAADDQIDPRPANPMNSTQESKSRDDQKAVNPPKTSEPVKPGTADQPPRAVAPGTLDAPPKPEPPGTLDNNVRNPDVEGRKQGKPTPK